RSALHVVLPAQWMQAGARPADLTGDQRQRNQATRIVGTMGMLRNAHAPENDRGFGASKFARDSADDIGLDAADPRQLLRRVVLDAVGELLEALDVSLDVLLVVELLGDDCVEHAVEQRDIGARLELHHVSGMALERLAARIGYDQCRATLCRLLEERRRNRVIFRWVGADYENDFGVLALIEGRRHCAGADSFHQCRYGRSVAEPGAMIDIVGAEAGADELLEQISLFVGAFGRAKPGERLRPV